MLCQRCHQNQATVFFSQTVGNQTTQSHLCEPCAQLQAQTQKLGGVFPPGFNPLSVLSEMMGNLMGFDPGAIAEVASGRAGSVAVDPQLQCPACGYQLSTFRQNGRLGCTKCYASFKAQLEPLINNIHGNAKFMGEGGELEKRPESSPAPDRRSKDPRVVALRERMGEAILKEKFEEAARIRDEIRKIEENS
jgi:protein arginine kinase activator